MNTGKVLLDVMICTYGDDGLARVAGMDLPRVGGVRYVVSCQSEPKACPAALDRDDVMISFNDSRGLSENRNHALSVATAPYGLIADDDLHYTGDRLGEVLKILGSNPDVDIATFRHEGIVGKVYPDKEWDLKDRYKNYFVNSIEIALRLDRIRSAGLRFSRLAGIGAPYLHAGEEELFVHNALRKGLRGRFFPVTVAVHPGPSTGLGSVPTPGVLRARGALIGRMYPVTALLRLPLAAVRSGVPFFPALLRLYQGWIYGIRHRKEL